MERGEDPDRGLVTGHCVDGPDRPGLRRIAGGSDRPHRPGHRLDEEVLARPIAVRAVLAVAGDLGVDQARVDRVQLLPADAEPLGRADAVVLDEDVARPDKIEDGGETVRMLEVERDRALVPVEAEEGRRLAADPERPEPVRPVVLAGARRLELDDVCSEIAEAHPADRPCQHLRGIDNADPSRAPATSVIV